MINKFINKNHKRTLVLLHGTGGDENDLIFLGELIDSSANILGIRGNIVENGMNRFFKRKAPGILDEENIREEAHNLQNFLVEFSKEHDLNIKEFVTLGFSNGANILASLLYHYGNIFKANILLHPMRPFKEFTLVNQSGNLIYITSGLNDKITPINESEKLRILFEEKSAIVNLKTYNFGHQLSEIEIRDLVNWYKKIAIKN
ncbi:MAG: dienelactone hydrolase family protein [Candidatus Izimaplasma sp.]|nr:dienelactone hydrolase family protein [Candidatus Izimaplasma bacterium]